MGYYIEEYKCSKCGHPESHMTLDLRAASLWDEFAELIAVGISPGEKFDCTLCGGLMVKQLTKSL
jgi:hypothetical protein